MHLFQQRILVLPQLVDPALELQAVFPVLVVILANELRRYLQLFKVHHYIRHISAQQIPETGMRGWVVDGHVDARLQLFTYCIQRKDSVERSKAGAVAASY